MFNSAIIARDYFRLIRPTGAGQLDAVGAINGFIADGLFIGQPKEFNELLLHLAQEADEARPEL